MQSVGSFCWTGRSTFLCITVIINLTATNQTSGTAIMTKIYNSHGWQPTAGTAIAFLGVGILTLLVRGPHEIGWIGWNGGWKVLKKEKMSDTSANAVTEKLKSKTKKGQSVKPVEGPIEGEKNV